MFLVLDMNLGYFLHYNSRENFINDRVPTYYVPLKKIKKCTKKKIKSGNIVKHCIVLKVKHFLVNYYSYYQDQTDQWLEYLNYGIFYMKYCY